MGVDHCDGRSFAQPAVQAAVQDRVQAGRVEPEIWDDVTEPRIDMSRFGERFVPRVADVERGASEDEIEPGGWLS